MEQTLKKCEMVELDDDERERVLRDIDRKFINFANKWEGSYRKEWKRLFESGRADLTKPVRAGHVYGLAKVHKLKTLVDIPLGGLPMRAISSCIGTALYHLGTFL